MLNRIVFALTLALALLGIALAVSLVLPALAALPDGFVPTTPYAAICPGDLYDLMGMPEVNTRFAASGTPLSVNAPTRAEYIAHG